KLLDRVKLLRSITSASLADGTPMAMIGKPFVRFSTTGANAGETKVIHSAHRYAVGRDYFETVGIPILRGRGFRKQDETDENTAAIVSEKLVKECWTGEDPVGRRIEMEANEGTPGFALPSYRSPADRRPEALGKKRILEVVGVAKNVRDGLVMAAADVPPVIYLPLRPADLAHPALRGVTLVARSAPGSDAIGALRREISALDASITPFDARGMVDQIDQMMFPVRAALWTYGFIGLFGLILASVGLAGMT